MTDAANPPSAPLPPQVAFRLPNLPRDLRFMVYDYLASHVHHPITIYRDDLDPANTDSEGESDIDNEPEQSALTDEQREQTFYIVMLNPLAASIHLACRATHTEATPILSRLYLDPAALRGIVPLAPSLSRYHHLDFLQVIVVVLAYAARSYEEGGPVAFGNARRFGLDVRARTCRVFDCLLETNTFLDASINRNSMRLLGQHIATAFERRARALGASTPDLHVALPGHGLSDSDTNSILETMDHWIKGYGPRLTLYDAFRSSIVGDIRDPSDALAYGGVITRAFWYNRWAWD